MSSGSLNHSFAILLSHARVFECLRLSAFFERPLGSLIGSLKHGNRYSLGQVFDPHLVIQAIAVRQLASKGC